MTIVLVRPVPGTELAENKDEAAKFRQEIVLPAFETEKKVVLDFSLVETATQSYVHALIAEAVQRDPERAFKLIEFRSCSPSVQQIVKTVFEYTLLARESAGDRVPESEGAS